MGAVVKRLNLTETISWKAAFLRVVLEGTRTLCLLHYCAHKRRQTTPLTPAYPHEGTHKSIASGRRQATAVENVGTKVGTAVDTFTSGYWDAEHTHLWARRAGAPPPDWCHLQVPRHEGGLLRQSLHRGTLLLLATAAGQASSMVYLFVITIGCCWEPQGAKRDILPAPPYHI